MERRFVGIDELAKYLGMSKNTVRYWVFTRQIPYCKIGRSVRFEKQEIDNWVNNKKVKPQ
jgi:excisionase family DNA binding protein